MWRLAILLLCSTLSSYAYTGKLGYVSVNSEMVPTPRSDAPQNVTYTSGTYYFTADEQANVSCVKLDSGEEIHSLMSFKKGRETGATILDQLPHNNEIYMKWTSDFDNGYIHCQFEIIKDEIKVLYDTRIMLHMKATPPDFGIQVNGLILTPDPSERVHGLFYQYEYFVGEQLIVQSFKNEKKYQSMTCKGNNIPNEQHYLKTEMTEENIYFSITMKLEYPITSLECVVRLIPASYLHVLIKFIPNSFNYSPAVHGLSMANVLLKSIGEKTNVIHYEIEDKETIYLKCYSKKTWPIWKSNDPQVRLLNSVKYTYTRDTSQFEAKATFVLESNTTSAEVECKTSDDKQTKVVLFRKKNESNLFTARDAECISTRKEETGAEKESGWLAVGGSCGAVVLVAGVAAALVLTVRNKMTKRALQTVKVTESDATNYTATDSHRDTPEKYTCAVPKDPCCLKQI